MSSRAWKGCTDSVVTRVDVSFEEGVCTHTGGGGRRTQDNGKNSIACEGREG